MPVECREQSRLRVRAGVFLEIVQNFLSLSALEYFPGTEIVQLLSPRQRKLFPCFVFSVHPMEKPELSVAVFFSAASPSSLISGSACHQGSPCWRLILCAWQC